MTVGIFLGIYAFVIGVSALTQLCKKTVGEIVRLAGILEKKVFRQKQIKTQHSWDQCPGSWRRLSCGFGVVIVDLDEEIRAELFAAGVRGE